MSLEEMQVGEEDTSMLRRGDHPGIIADQNSNVLLEQLIALHIIHIYLRCVRKMVELIMPSCCMPRVYGTRSCLSF